MVAVMTISGIERNPILTLAVLALAVAALVASISFAYHVSELHHPRARAPLPRGTVEACRKLALRCDSHPAEDAQFCVAYVQSVCAEVIVDAP
jgi:hypothetical protein